MATLKMIADIVKTTDVERFNDMPEANLFPGTRAIFNQVMRECRALLGRDEHAIDCRIQQEIDVTFVNYRLIKEAVEYRIGERAPLVFKAKT